MNEKNIKNIERKVRECPKCSGTGKEADSSDCTLCDGKGKLDTIKIGDNEVLVKDKARFVG